MFILAVFIFNTQVLECVTINLTFVYALFAYVHIKQTNVNRLMVGWLLIALE